MLSSDGVKWIDFPTVEGIVDDLNCASSLSCWDLSNELNFESPSTCSHYCKLFPLICVYLLQMV